MCWLGGLHSSPLVDWSCPRAGPSALRWPQRALSPVTDLSPALVQWKELAPGPPASPQSIPRPLALHVPCHKLHRGPSPIMVLYSFPCPRAAQQWCCHIPDRHTESSRPYLDVDLAAFHFNGIDARSGHAENTPGCHTAPVYTPGRHCCLWRGGLSGQCVGAELESSLCFCHPRSRPRSLL